MNSGNNSSSPVAKMIPVLIFAAGLIGLYYLYQYLFGPNTNSIFPLLAKTQSAVPKGEVHRPAILEDGAITIDYNSLPVIVEGGEFSVSTWVYINDWSYRRGSNKSILILGGTEKDTLRIYLGGNTPQLFVRFHTYSSTNSTPGAGANQQSATVAKSDDLRKETRDQTFQSTQTGSGLLDDAHEMCDLPEIPMQRWVNITVAANGKTVDVYLDGKLSRSCVLTNLYQVDSRYTAKLIGYGGFGGQISTTTMYDSALNPEAVYKNYMAGPEPVTSIMDWFSNTFAPGVTIAVTTK